jgi:hypothetical protein
MKKVLILSAALLAFAVPAFATIDLAWNACPAQGGTADVVLDCANASGLAALYGVVSTPVAIVGFVNMDCVIDLQVDLPNSLTAFHNFQDPVVNPAGCNDGWIFGDERGPAATCAASTLLWGATPPNVGGSQGTAAAGYKPNPSASRGRFVTTTFRSSTAPINLVANTLYFGFHLDLYTLQATEAGGACDGCTVPMRIAFNEASLGSLSSVNGVEAAPVVVTQPGAFGIESSSFGGGSIPAGATPTQNRSWGALKSLYR